LLVFLDLPVLLALLFALLVLLALLGFDRDLRLTGLFSFLCGCF
jgi:hypothetical protein